MHDKSNALEHVICLYTGQATSSALIIYIAILTTNYILEIQEVCNLRVLTYALKYTQVYASYPTDMSIAQVNTADI